MNITLKTPSSPFRKQWSTSPICRPDCTYLLIKKDVYFQVCTLIIFFAALVAVISGASCLYLVRRVINRGIVEKEAIINNHFERVLDGGLFGCRCQKNSTVCITRHSPDDLTKAMGRKSFDEDLKALPEKAVICACLTSINSKH